MPLLRIGRSDRAHERCGPTPVLNGEMRVEGLDETLVHGLGQFALPELPGLLNDRVDETDASVEQLHVHLDLSQLMPAGEMEPFGLLVSRHDHPHRDAVVLSGPQFTHTDRDQFLARWTFAPHGMPLLKHLGVQGGWVKDLPHIKWRAVGFALRISRQGPRA